MAGRERHFRKLRHVPGADHEAPRIGIAPDFVDEPGNLIDGLAVRALPAPPLLAVNRSEVAVRIGPFVPDRDAVFLQVGDVRFAAQEPEQFVDDRLQVQFLGRDQRKTVGEIETQLPAEQRARAGAGAVGFLRAVFQHVAQQFEVLPHQAAAFAGMSVGARRDIHNNTMPTTISGIDCSCPMVSHPNAR